MDDRTRSKGFSFAAVLFMLISGAVVGAALALIKAPSLGEELKRRIADAGRDAEQRTRRAAGAAKNSYGDGMARSKKILTETYRSAETRSGAQATKSHG